MIKKSLLCAVLFLSSLTLVYAKSYDIHLPKPATAGKLQLEPGAYNITITGNVIVFKDVHMKTYTTPVKLETLEKKNRGTVIETTKDGDNDKIRDILLGGTTTKVQFID
jgi:hypothetical protein